MTIAWLRPCFPVVLLFLSQYLVSAEPVRVQNVEGSFSAFLVLRSLQGRILAAGDLTQRIQTGLVVSRLVFHFKDGSVDDETTEYSQENEFRLVRDHHIQKGPSFPHPQDLAIDASTNQVTIRSSSKSGQVETKTKEIDLPADLANGIIFNLLKNLPARTTETKVSYLASTPEPKTVQLSIRPQGTELFSVGGVRHKANHLVIRVELGGLTGIIAPLIGKQPADFNVWVTGGEVPAVVRIDGPLYLGGPIWSIQYATLLWPKAFPADH